jgi:hypothetical protein
MSPLASVASALNSALPLVNMGMEALDKSKVGDYVTEWRKIGEASAQGVNGTELRTRQDFLETRIQKELTYDQQLMFKKAAGVDMFRNEREALEVQKESQEAFNIGQNLGYEGDEAYKRGEEVRASMAQMSQQQKADALELQASETGIKLQTQRGFQSTSSTFAKQDAMLAKKVLLPISLGAIDPSTPQGQAQMEAMATQIEAAVQARTIQVNGMESLNGHGVAYRTGAINGATSSLTALATNLRSTVKGQQDAALKTMEFLSKKATVELAASLGPKFGKLLLGDKSGRVAAAAAEKLLQAKDNKLAEAVESWETASGDVVTTAEGIDIPTPFNPFRDAIRVFKQETAVADEKDLSKAFELADTASIAVKNYQKDQKITPEEGEDYSKTFLNLMDGVTKSTNTERKMSWLQTANSETHRQFVEGLSLPQKDAISKKTADTSFLAMQQYVSKVGIPDALQFDGVNGVWTVNTQAVADAALKKGEESGMVSAFNALLGRSAPARASEAEMAKNMLTPLNTMMAIMSENISRQTKGKGLSDQQIKFMAAKALEATNAGVIKVNGEIKMPEAGHPFVTQMTNITPEQLVNEANTGIQETIQSAVVGSPVKLRIKIGQ